VKTFQRWNDARAVAPLVDRLAHEGDGGVQDFIACALEAITGQKLERDSEAWASYLIQERHARDEEVTHAALTERRAGEPGQDGESKE